MKRLLLTALLAAFALPAQAQTVILVRHAEKADQSADPVLSEAGQRRAAALASAVSDAGLTHVLVTPLQRTRLTSAVAAQAHGLEPEAIALDGGTQAHVDRVAARVRALPEDAVVLVVGHSNTVPLIAQALGQTGAGEMQDCEYDRLTIITVEADGASPTVVGRYGEASLCA